MPLGLVTKSKSQTTAVRDPGGPRKPGGDRARIWAPAGRGGTLSAESSVPPAEELASVGELGLPPLREPEREREGAAAPGTRGEQRPLAPLVTTATGAEPAPAPLGHGVPQAPVAVKPLGRPLAHKAPEPGSLPGPEEDKDDAYDVAARGGAASLERPQALPPKENPCTKKSRFLVTAAPGQLGSQNLAAAAAAAALPPEPELSSPQNIEAGILKTQTTSMACDFSDITNWPTPSELGDIERQKVTNQPKKKPQDRTEKEEKTEKRTNRESKDNREAKHNVSEENVSEGEAKSNHRRKRANKPKWVPLHLDDVRPDRRERRGSRNSSRSQPEPNESAQNNPPTDSPRRRRETDNRDDQDEVSSGRSAGGTIPGRFRRPGRGPGWERGRDRGHPPRTLEYSYEYPEPHGESPDQPFQPQLYPNMMYYYDDGTRVQIYSVDETLLKEYIKRQIEYYFSIENLERDFFLRRNMDEHGFLPISLIASFPRVQALTTNVHLIVEALKDSAEVEIVGQNMRKKVAPEKWPIPDTAPRNVPQIDFSQLVDCPESIPSKAFGSHTGLCPRDTPASGHLPGPFREHSGQRIMYIQESPPQLQQPHSQEPLALLPLVPQTPTFQVQQLTSPLYQLPQLHQCQMQPWLKKEEQPCELLPSFNENGQPEPRNTPKLGLGSTAVFPDDVTATLGDLASPQEHLDTPLLDLHASQGHLAIHHGYLGAQQGHLSPPQGHLAPPIYVCIPARDMSPPHRHLAPPRYVWVPNKDIYLLTRNIWVPT
ncbi:la-related protein 1-like [Dromiciops gliroides]|uniref:la-related protein 1-like n=1 Tax=Dromiciops gliroides TaxID=33562 RepID=UPI001CC44A7D|nr:la-related protein 1-like [Dromiciops gliroides]